MYRSSETQARQIRCSLTARRLWWWTRTRLVQVNSPNLDSTVNFESTPPTTGCTPRRGSHGDRPRDRHHERTQWFELGTYAALLVLVIGLKGW